MTTRTLRIREILLAALTVVTMASTKVLAQCPAAEVTAGLDFPLGIAQTNEGNFVVAESGRRGVLHSGRISIIDSVGTRRTLLEGLPSATNDVGDPSGPAGVFMRGRTLYLVIGIGNNVLPGPIPRTAVVNPNPSSPIFSSVLAIHFSAHTEKITNGFSLTPADHLALANGETVRLANGHGDSMTVQLISNLPDFVLNPPPNPTLTIRAASNPFDLVALGDQLYVADGGRNLVWQADIRSGAASVLAEFPNIPNPAFPGLGGPFLEAVPAGIAKLHGQILVTLFRGFPFTAGTSVVERIDPATGNHAPFISGLKAAIDVRPIRREKDSSVDYLVLQHASGVVLSGPGTLTHFDGGSGQSTVIASCLNRPTSMARDKKTGAVYITELVNGRLVVIEQ